MQQAITGKEGTKMEKEEFKAHAEDIARIQSADPNVDDGICCMEVMEI